MNFKYYLLQKNKKLIDIMKFSFIILLINTLTISATAYSQVTKFNLIMNDVSFEDIFKEVERNSNFTFLYRIGLIDNRKTMSLDVENATVENILDRILEGTDVAYNVLENNLVILTKASENVMNRITQSITITGTITDTEGEPLPGVSIAIKGTSQGTVTDANGAYSLPVPGENAILMFSYVGFVTQEILVGSKRIIHVTLRDNARELEEVVVIGYGVSSKKRLTTSVGSIKSENLNALPITNIGHAFAGQLAGVLADQSNGQPGAMPVMRIRGYGSINAGSEPLYVIDGVMATSSQFAMLNPKSVESIDVLKDAAAGAIYGSRAGNGVIMVTTKKGKTGDAAFSVNATFGLQQLEKKIDVLNTTEWLDFVKEAYANDGKALPDFYNRPASAFANTDWQDEVYRTSTYQNYQMTASGGNEKLKYYMDANYLHDEGIMLTIYNKIYSSNGSFDLTLKPRLKLGLTYLVSHGEDRTHDGIQGFAHNALGYGIAGGIVQNATWMPPIIPVYDEIGDYGQLCQKEFQPFFPAGFANPVANLLETKHMNYRNKALTRGYITYEPIDGLNLNASLSYSTEGVRREYHVSPYIAGTNSPNANFSNPVYERMAAGQSNSMWNNYIADLYANYKKVFAEKHNIDITLGYSAQYQETKTTTASASLNDRGTANALNPIPIFSNYYRPNIYGAAMVLGGGDFQENSFESIFARVNYSFKDRYIFMGSIRRDGSSKFAPNNRFGYFPAASAAWRLSEEDFIKKTGWINDLKLRASYGISGNDQFGNYVWNGNVSYGNLYTYGPIAGGAAGSGIVLLPSSIENRNLKWETNEQINFAVDLSVFNNRIGLTAEYFIRNTKNMLLNRSLPSENGITSSILDNIGNMTNKGVELSLNTMIVKTNDWSWSLNANFTKIKNKVGDVFTSTGDIRYQQDGFGSFRIVEGQPLFQIYSWKVIGNFETQEQLDTYAKPGNAILGDVMIEDFNKDGIINDDDLQPLGCALPDFTYGINSTLRYKNFDLSIFMDGSHGASLFMMCTRNPALIRCAENTLRIFYEDRYRKGETGHNFAYASTGVTGYRHQNQSYFIRDASYLKIRNITLGYSLPSELCSKVKINDLRFTLSIQNVYTFTSYPLYNPQANSAGGSAGTAQFGVDNGNYPLSRIFSAGLSFTF